MYCSSNNIRYFTKKVIKLNLNYRKLSTDTLAFDTRRTMLKYCFILNNLKWEKRMTNVLLLIVFRFDIFFFSEQKVYLYRLKKSQRTTNYINYRLKHFINLLSEMFFFSTLWKCHVNNKDVNKRRAVRRYIS